MPARNWSKKPNYNLPGWDEHPLKDWSPTRGTVPKDTFRQCLICGPSFTARTTWHRRRGIWRCTKAPPSHSWLIGKSPAELKAILSAQGWSRQWL